MAMRYAVWWVRLVYAAWMVPAGLNHFIPLYPQPGGANPLSDGVFTALLASHRRRRLTRSDERLLRRGALALPRKPVVALGGALVV